jgi:hypothetical protein
MRKIACAIASLIAICDPASAAPVMIACEQEDAVTQNWSGALNITYDDEKVAVKSEHLDFTVPVDEVESKAVVDSVEVTTRRISGAGEITANVPAAEDLLQCAANSVAPEFKTDQDIIALAIPHCLSKTPPAVEPVAMTANVTIGLISTKDPMAPDVIVEISRSYQGDVALKLDVFPRNCAVVQP